MPVSKKQQACVNRYVSKHYDKITVTCPKGQRDRYKTHAEQRGKSLTALIVELLENDIKNNGGN